MQVLTFIVVAVVIKMVVAYKPLNKRIEDADNNPNNSVKSDRYLKTHPEWKGR